MGTTLFALFVGLRRSFDAPEVAYGLFKTAYVHSGIRMHKILIFSLTDYARFFCLLRYKDSLYINIKTVSTCSEAVKPIINNGLIIFQNYTHITKTV